MPRNREYINEITGMLPPQAVDVEEIILGTILIEDKTIHKVANELNVESFYKDANKRIYMACLDLWEDGEPIDLVTVAQRLIKSGHLEHVGGANYISQLTSRVNSSANLDFHIKIVFQKAVKRNIINICNEALKKAYDDRADPFDLVDELLLKSNDINKQINQIGTKGTAQHAKELIEDIKKARVSEDNYTGITSGFKEYDNKTTGYQNGNLYIEAGRPGMGKSAKMLSSIRAQLSTGKKVALFSLEMPGKQLIARMVSQELKLYHELIQRPKKLNENDYEKLLNEIEKFKSNPNLLIDDKAGLTPNQLRGRIMDFQPEIVWIDYLQLMDGDDKNKRGREEIVSDISRSCKKIAKDFDIPVIALAQLSRAVETRGGDKIPMLSDLRESGSIEQDADVVTFFYRPEYYGFKPQDTGFRDNVMLSIIAKNRHGEESKIETEFVKQTMTVRDFPDEFMENDLPPFPQLDYKE